MRKAIFLFILFLTLSATAQENYMEKANYYYSKLNYEQAFEYYFLELEARPNQYNIIKSRLQTYCFMMSTKASPTSCASPC